MMMTARDRYRNDPTFAAIVNTIRAMLHNAQTTPSELREAVMIAAYLEEAENPTPVFYRIKALAHDLLGDL